MAAASSGDTLVAARSPDGTLVALYNFSTLSSLSLLRISLFRVDSGDLQTTLTYRSRRDADSSAVAATTMVVKKLLFLQQPQPQQGSTTWLAALTTAGNVIVWDLNRGVVACEASKMDPQRIILDMTRGDADTASESSVWYWLGVSSSSSSSNHSKQKLYVYQVDTSTGVVVRKIKAGKLSWNHDAQAQLVVLNDTKNNDNNDAQKCIIIQTSDGVLRVVNADTGAKICKTTVTPSSPNIICMTAVAPLACVATVNQGRIVLIHWRNGQTLLSWPLPSAATSLQLIHASTTEQQQQQQQPLLLLCVNQTHFYQLPLTHQLLAAGAATDDSTLPRCVATLHMDPTVDQSTLMGGGGGVAAVAVLHKKQPAAWQFSSVFSSHQWEILQKQQPPPDSSSSSSSSSSSKTSPPPLPITIAWNSPETTKTKTTAATRTKKRDKDAATAILGPVQAGGEAFQASEGPQTKKTRVVQSQKEVVDHPSMDDDADADMESVEDHDHQDDDDDDEEEEGATTTIAERLAQLQQALDDDNDNDNNINDDSDQDAKDDPEQTRQFLAKRATTESLTQLLQQALQSGDDALLELALSVKDRRVLEETCRSLVAADTNASNSNSNTNLPILLLTALTTRLAAKPARAEHLCVWLQILLQTGKVQSPLHLQPLRNLLQERLQVFPALLQLEGRLSMMSSL